MFGKIKRWCIEESTKEGTKYIISVVAGYFAKYFGDKTNWSFMNPFLWYIVALVVFFISLFLLKKLLNRNTKTSNKQKELIEIVSRHYENETVILDGYKYVECQFDACTVKYNGDKFELDGTAINSNCKMVFTHPVAVVTAKILYAQFKNAKSIDILDQYNRVINDERFVSISEKSKF